MAEKENSFESLGLDYRLLRAIEKKNIIRPTSVQTRAIPHALEGQDIVARAHTGTGKTLAYLAPAIHSLLQTDTNALQSLKLCVLILVPTSELCQQVQSEATSLVVQCAANIRSTVLAADKNQRTLERCVANAGQIVVSTPGRLAKAIKGGSLKPDLLSNLQVLILDEADLLLTYGYESDLQMLTPMLPRTAQRMLMSATMSSDVSRLTALLLNNPTILDCTSDSSGVQTSTNAPDITHTYIRVASDTDRFLAILTLMRLGLVPKKTLLFTSTPDRAYRARLLLEAFGTHAATLVATLPLESRHHAIEQFNTSAFDILIAAEASASATSNSDSNSAEFGVTRGIDFKGVQTVINIDAPSTTAAYTHRVGRTGRAGAQGLAITLIGPSDSAFLTSLHTSLPEHYSASGDAPGEAATLQEFSKLTEGAMAALRYRATDVLRSLTKGAVQEARARDLKLQVLNSDRLKEFFDTHQLDAQALKHDRQLAKHAHKLRHLRQMPDYLKASAGVASSATRRRLQGGTAKRAPCRGTDPLRGAAAFGARKDEEPTEMEEAALKVAKRKAKKQKKDSVSKVFKQNVRKRR